MDLLSCSVLDLGKFTGKDFQISNTEHYLYFYVVLLHSSRDGKVDWSVVHHFGGNISTTIKCIFMIFFQTCNVPSGRILLTLVIL